MLTGSWRPSSRAAICEIRVTIKNSACHYAFWVLFHGPHFGCKVRSDPRSYRHKNGWEKNKKRTRQLSSSSFRVYDLFSCFFFLFSFFFLRERGREAGALAEKDGAPKRKISFLCLFFACLWSHYVAVGPGNWTVNLKRNLFSFVDKYLRSFCHSSQENLARKKSRNLNKTVNITVIAIVLTVLNNLILILWLLQVLMIMFWYYLPGTGPQRYII